MKQEGLHSRFHSVILQREQHEATGRRTQTPPTVETITTPAHLQQQAFKKGHLSLYKHFLHFQSVRYCVDLFNGA